MNPTTMPGLDDVQGNILKGHGRDHTAMVFFRFARREVAQENRRLLRDVAAGARQELRLTSAAEQQRQSEARRGNPQAPEEVFRSLGLSVRGLRACGFEDGGFDIPPEWRNDQFWSGARITDLIDQGAWDPAFALSPDGMFLVAHNEAATRDDWARKLAATLRRHYGVDAVEIENGFQWRPFAHENKRVTYEHFGFADGFARTEIVAGRDSPLRHLVEATMGFVRDTVRPFQIPLEQVMFTRGSFVGGSVVVVHKLEQNVQGFLKTEQALSKRLRFLPRWMRLERAGTLFIGRNSRGRPLVPGAKDEEHFFHFGGDPAGKRCPFSAHIRKMNPRQNKLHGRPHDQARRDEQKRTQFVRRGVLYGDPAGVRLHWDKPENAPGGGVGMLFTGYMTLVGDQFLKMLVTWGPDTDFPQRQSAADPLFGGGGKVWSWLPHPKLAKPKAVVLPEFVRSKGLAYFMIAPLHWLRSL